MNLTTRLFLLLAVLTFTTGCGAQTVSTDTTKIDDLFAFDENGYATVRGRVTGDWACSTVDGKLRATLNIEVPVVVDGIEASLAMLFMLTFETALSSNLTPHTTLRDYLTANPDSSTFDAFPLFETVDVTFTKQKWDFEAVAIRQVDPAQDLQPTEIDGMLSTNMASKGSLRGIISGANWSEDLVMWTLSMPVTVQGMSASVLVPIQSRDDTQIVANGNLIPMDSYHPGGHVLVEFKRTGDRLEAIRFTEMQ